jgi:hypothetical protein
MKAHVEWVTDLAKAFKKVPGGWKMGDDTVMAGVERRGRVFLGCRVKGGPPRKNPAGVPWVSRSDWPGEKVGTQPVWVSCLVWSLRKYPARRVWASNLERPGEK